MDRNIIFPRSIRYLLAVAEHKSFTRAAEALYVSQPTLSQQIKQLEESLDTLLLDRSGRAIRLTDAGEVYLHHARRALVELDAGQRAIHDLADLSRGSLRLGMTPITDHMTTTLLDHFSSRHPGITVSTNEMPQDELEAGVANDSLDIGIAFTNNLSSLARSSELDSQVLFVESLCLAVADGHSLARENHPIHAEALEQQPLVLLNDHFAMRRHLDLYCLEHGITPRVTMEANSLSVIIEIVRLGRLATVLPSSISSAQQGLCSLLLLPELPHHSITLVCRRGAYKSPACRAFVDLASYWAASRPQQHERAQRASDASLSGG